MFVNMTALTEPRMGSQAKEDTRRRSMLPQMTTTKRNLPPVEARQDHNDQMPMAERPLGRTKSDATAISSGTRRTRTIQRLGSEVHITEPLLEKKTPTNAEVKAPRVSAIVAPRSEYSRMPSRKFSKPIAPISEISADTTAVQSRRPASEVRSNEPQTIRPFGHTVTMSAMKQARPESTIPRHGRSNSRQLSANIVPPMSLPPSKQEQRPAFSTLQQHFTPKKVTKAPTASFLGPPPGKQDGDNTLPGEISRLQMELAQLHLLHRDSIKIQAQWEKSAERSLQRRFESLSKQHVELKEIACESQALINQSTLVAWCQHLSDFEIAEKVQILSRCIVEISSILSFDSKISRIFRLFEAWSTRASWIQEIRRHSTKGEGQALEFIEGIGDDWKAEVDILNTKLSYLSRELKSLGEVRERSSISRVLVMLQSIVSNLTCGHDLIRRIEHEVMAQETVWVQEMVKNLGNNVANDIDAIATSHKGIWHNED